MHNDYIIRYIINDFTYLDKISTDQQLLSVPGYLDITINKEELTRREGSKVLNDAGIIGFALNFQVKLPELLKNPQAHISIDYGDDWQICLRRQEDLVFCDIFNRLQDQFAVQNKMIPLEQLLKEIFAATIMLESAIQLQAHSFPEGSVVLRTIRRYLYRNMWKSLQKGIVSERDMGKYFGEYFEGDGLNSDFLKQHDPEEK